MTTTITNVHRLARGVTWGLAVLIAFLLFNQAVYWQQNGFCQSLLVEVIREPGEQAFIGQQEVQTLVVSQLPTNSIESVRIKEMDLRKIETYLEQNPYIGAAEVFTDIRNRLNVRIEQRHPLLRVISRQNTSFYLSKEGNKMPANGQFAARVPVATGAIDDKTEVADTSGSAVLKGLFLIAEYVDENEFWQASIEQIYVEADGDFILVPKFANHEIIFGKAEDINHKFDQLLTFYREGLSRVGWYTYKTVSVKYKNQIVCTK